MVRCILRTPSLQHKSPKTDVSVVSIRFVQLNRMQWIAAGGRISLSFTFHMLLFMYWIRLHSFDVVRLGHRHLNFSNRQHCDCKINRNTLNLLVYGWYVPLPARHTDHDHMFFFVYASLSLCRRAAMTSDVCCCINRYGQCYVCSRYGFHSRLSAILLFYCWTLITYTNKKVFPYRYRSR